MRATQSVRQPCATNNRAHNQNHANMNTRGHAIEQHEPPTSELAVWSTSPQCSFMNMCMHVLQRRGSQLCDSCRSCMPRVPTLNPTINTRSNHLLDWLTMLHREAQPGCPQKGAVASHVEQADRAEPRSMTISGLLRKSKNH